MMTARSGSRAIVRSITTSHWNRASGRRRAPADAADCEASVVRGKGNPAGGAGEAPRYRGPQQHCTREGPRRAGCFERGAWTPFAGLKEQHGARRPGFVHWPGRASLCSLPRRSPGDRGPAHTPCTPRESSEHRRVPQTTRSGLSGVVAPPRRPGRTADMAPAQYERAYRANTVASSGFWEPPICHLWTNVDSRAPVLQFDAQYCGRRRPRSGTTGIGWPRARCDGPSTLAKPRR